MKAGAGRKAARQRERRAERAGNDLEELLADTVATQTRSIVEGFTAQAGELAVVAAGGDNPTPRFMWGSLWSEALWAAALAEAEGMFAVFTVAEFAEFGIVVTSEQPLVQRLAAEAVADLDGWSLELKAQVGRIIDDGHRDLLSVRDVASKLADHGDLTQTRAQSIAQTEMISASNTASHQAAETFAEPGDTKKWLSSQDQRVRDSHKKANKQVVPFDQPFIVGGARLQHPGDRSGPAEEVLRCRCSWFWQPAG